MSHEVVDPDSGHVERDCPECQSGSVTTGEGERICENCGLVLDDERIDQGPEWRAFSESEREERSRVGPPATMTVHDKGLTTEIGWKNTAAGDRTLTGERQAQFSRLRRLQKRIRVDNPGERNLQFALGEVDRIASALGLPRSVREVASVIYRRALDADLIRGHTMEGVAASAVYTACRRLDIPRSLQEVAAVSRVDRKTLGRTYRYVVNGLELEMEPVDPKQYVPRFCSELGLSEEVHTEALDIIDTTVSEGLLSGKSPTGFAAAAIYAASIMCNEKRTQHEVAEVADTTVVTIRNRYQEQMEAVYRS